MKRIKNRPKGWRLLRPGETLKGTMRCLAKTATEWEKGITSFDWVGQAKIYTEDACYWFRKVGSK